MFKQLTLKNSPAYVWYTVKNGERPETTLKKLERNALLSYDRDTCVALGHIWNYDAGVCKEKPENAIKMATQKDINQARYVVHKLPSTTLQNGSGKKKRQSKKTTKKSKK